MTTPRDCVPLDGDWRLALDPEDAGLSQRWFDGDAPEGALEVRVPSVWDRWAPDYDGVGWYFKTFEAPSDWAGRHVELQFDAVDYYAEAWLNGVRLGDHEGGYTPFSFNIAALLRPGANRLAVRVIDPHGPEGFGPFRRKEIPCSKEETYFTFAGIWGSVRLEAKPRIHIEDLFVQPDPRKSCVRVDVTASGGGDVFLEIEGTPFHAQGAPGELTIDFPGFAFWSPESPTLYTLRARLTQPDGAFDEMRIRFGMRDFTVKDGRFQLNNHPYFVKAVLHQPDYPRSLAGPESEDFARREIALAKEAGFNMMRLHIKTAPKITLELADEMGMLLYEEPPIGWIRHSEDMQERCENEVREMILRDRNHASVAIWGMLNETGNADYVTNGGAQRVKDALCLLARSLDPTRLIIDDSGGVNATRESARMIRPYRDVFEEYDDLHVYQRAPVDLDIENYYRHNGSPGMTFFLSEFGFGGSEDLEDVIAQYGADRAVCKDARYLEQLLAAMRQGFDARELDRVFGSFAGFTEAMRELQADAARFQVDAIRSNSKCSGYCYTQLFDAGHEFCAGVGDRWRRPKPVSRALAAAQAPLRPAIQMARTNLGLRDEVPVAIVLFNEIRTEERCDLSLQVVGPTNQVLWKKKRGVKLPKHNKELWSGSIGASGSHGTHKFVVRLMQGMTVLAENSIEFHVVPALEPSGVNVNILDPNGVWTPRIRPFATPSNLLAPVHIVPPLANSIRAYPDNELIQTLAQVEGGAVAIFFAPPADWNDLADRLSENIMATPKDAVGCFLPVVHYAKMHPVFSGLPSRCLMRQPYRNIVAPVSFTEDSDEDICGSYDAMPAAPDSYMFNRASWWGSDILVRRYGAGRIVFTHLRLLEHLGEDPVADRVFVNLLTHFARRSVPHDAPLPVNGKVVEWLRSERDHQMRKWMVIGEFPNWKNAGHDTAYPPETTLDFDATYPGWYRPVTWRTWHTSTRDGHKIDLQAAFAPIYEYYPRFDYGTGYAYAEFLCDRRQEVELELGLQNATKVWLNGRLVFETTKQVPHDQFERETALAFTKQGKNTVLVKCSKNPGPFRFAFDIRQSGSDLAQIKWWR